MLSNLFHADADRTWKIALEFRHNSWYTESLFEYSEENRISIVLHDIPASATPLDYYAVSDAVYLRFHGPGGKYRGSYDDDVLYEYASYIKEWQEEGKTVYVYFNNTMGDAVRNLETLNRIIKGE